MKISTYKIAAGGMLAALTIALAATPLGLIPVPSPAGAMTTIHIPVIIGGITLGPLVGSLLGLIFGLFTLRFAHWLIVIPGRLLIGPAAYYAYKAGHRLTKNLVLSGVLGAVAGTLANSVTVLTTAVLLPEVLPGAAVLPGSLAVRAKTALSIVAVNGTIEVVLAAVLVALVIIPLKKATGLPADGAEGRQATLEEVAEA